MAYHRPKGLRCWVGLLCFFVCSVIRFRWTSKRQVSGQQWDPASEKPAPLENIPVRENTASSDHLQPSTIGENSSDLKEVNPESLEDTILWNPNKCTKLEYIALFNNCFYFFAYDHYELLKTLQTWKHCIWFYFNCREVAHLMRCINSQPESSISDECWPNVPSLIGHALDNHNIPCTYKDVYKRCPARSAQILTLEERRKRRMRARSDTKIYQGDNPGI